MAASTVSALRITRTSRPGRRGHLPPFALWPAFPASDYYGGSVAVGVAPFRRSRVPHAVDVQDGLGARFVSSRLLEATQRPGVLRLVTTRREPSVDPPPQVLIGGVRVTSVFIRPYPTR